MMTRENLIYACAAISADRQSGRRALGAIAAILNEG
jgi:hypothetical protein